jgi:oligopeptidase A
MAGSPAQVLDFLHDLAARAAVRAPRPRRAGSLRPRKPRAGNAEAWDLAYAGDKLKQARYSFSEQDVKRYFTEPKVLAGLFDLIRPLRRAGEAGQRAGLASGRALLPHRARRRHAGGQFYLDLYAREGKRRRGWTTAATAATAPPGRRHRWCIWCATSATAATASRHVHPQRGHHPVPRNGHGLNQLLTEVGELGVPASTAWNGMRSNCHRSSWRISAGSGRVQAMSAHVDNGQPLPRALFDRMLAAKNFQSGMFTVRQLEFALFDMQLHTASTLPATRC